MAVKTWQSVKIQYCSHAGSEVAFEAQVIYPAEHLPEQLPRVSAHRCSHAMQCNLFKQPSCVWAGTNPNMDPFTSPE
jgi:hypothetical protein